MLIRATCSSRGEFGSFGGFYNVETLISCTIVLRNITMYFDCVRRDAYYLFGVCREEANESIVTKSAIDAARRKS